MNHRLQILLLISIFTKFNAAEPQKHDIDDLITSIINQNSEIREILYITSSTKSNEQYELDTLMKVISQTNKVPQNVCTFVCKHYENQKIGLFFGQYPLDNFNNQNILVFVNYKSHCKQKLFVELAKIMSENPNAKLVVHLHRNETFKTFDQILKNAYNTKLLNFMLVCSDFNKTSSYYQMIPFPQPSIDVFKFDRRNPPTLFPDRTENLHKIDITAAMVYSIPDLYKHTVNGKEELSGPDFHVIQTLVKTINGTLIPKPLKTLNRCPNADISSVIYDCSDKPAVVSKKIGYPFSMIKKCLFFPPQENIKMKHFYFVLPFDEASWVAVALSILYFGTVKAIISFRYFKNKDFIGSFFDIMKAIIYQTFKDKHLSGSQWKLRYFNFNILIFGFILTNIYLSLLTSFLIEPIYMKPPQTLQDIERNQLKIAYAREDESSLIASLNISKKYEHLLYAADFIDLEEFEKYSKYFGFLQKDDSINYLNAIDQLNGRKTKFFLTNICLQFNFKGLMIQTLFIHQERVRVHNMRVKDTGLYIHWQKNAVLDTYHQYREMDSFENESTSPKPLQWENFRIVWAIAAGGWILSLLIFIIELVIYYGVKLLRKCFCFKSRKQAVGYLK